jgi:hypothetical protein
MPAISSKGRGAVDQHCQIGNIDLACRVVTTWLGHTGQEPTGLG